MEEGSPVFAVDDESLMDALGNSLPLWKPGWRIGTVPVRCWNHYELK